MTFHLKLVNKTKNPYNTVVNKIDKYDLKHVINKRVLDTSQICFNRHEQLLEIEAGYER